MVIGYGFRDPHINTSIRVGIEKGLRVFIIAPEGAELASQLSPTRKRGQIISPTAEENMLKQALMGASRRALAETFGSDSAEFGKVMRFFQAV